MGQQTCAPPPRRLMARRKVVGRDHAATPKPRNNESEPRGGTAEGARVGGVSCVYREPAVGFVGGTRYI